MVTIALLPRPGPVTLQEAGATAQSSGARLLLERCHLPSNDPEGGSGRPLHQLAWSEALLGGELEAENLSFLGLLSVSGSLHCSEIMLFLAIQKHLICILKIKNRDTTLEKRNQYKT